MNFINNINSTENWANAKNLESNRVLGKRADDDKTKDIFQLIAECSGTSLD
jgi:hypothetical protein